MTLRLFTRTDLERCARLALRYSRIENELAVMDAVELVVNETPPLYDRETVLRVANYAAKLALNDRKLGEDDAAERAFREVCDGKPA